MMAGWGLGSLLRRETIESRIELAYSDEEIDPRGTLEIN